MVVLVGEGGSATLTPEGTVPTVPPAGMVFPYSQTLVRLRWTYTTDVYGDTKRVSPPISSDIPGCVVAPRSSSDITEPARQGVMVGLSVYAPINTDIDPVTDQVEYKGSVWDIDGGIGFWESPFSRLLDGIEFALRRAIG